MEQFYLDLLSKQVNLFYDGFVSSRWLKQTLILSLGLNVVFVALLFHLAYRDSSSRLNFAYRPGRPETLEIALPQEFASASFETLIENLKDPKCRKHALSALVKGHDFDVERALGSPPQKRLSDEDYKAICRFAKEEQYPFTARGLYKRLPETGKIFCFTPEFIQLQTLFARTQLPIENEILITLVSEGEFETLATYFRKQQEGANYEEGRRRQLLLDYIHDGSRTAAYLLLLTDYDFALATLPDEETVDLLQLLNVKTAEALRYCKALLDSSRSPLCKEKASEIAGRFYRRPGEGVLRPQWRERHPKALPNDTHVIQPGESLWTISRKYRVSIEDLMKVNNLHSTTLQPGRLLKIPHSRGS
ncbi:MAG: hypothetical protein S4CHLAM45_00500 [Chlamydiales bacterium]|nr:hypothetical protein [Chlamydiales bacterium]MCH9619372.1 hypothetical protein [Chlamydiales bacterium]MCH9622176.1 hypothetical protein [Chlamydiales bacterium]